MEKKVLLSALGGLVVSTVLGGLVYGFLLKDYMAQFAQAAGNAVNMDPGMGYIVVANFLLCVLIAWAIYKQGNTTLAGGFMTTLWIGLIIFGWFDTWMLATFSFMNFQMAAVDVVSNTLTTSVSGAVIALIQSKIN